MAAAAGILHQQTVSQALAGNAMPMEYSTAATGSSDSSSNSSSDSATISANDFLTLLVTEMQNQDPTADTDPNEYINQLVQVNSLEQLISMNQTLTAAFDPSGAAATQQSTDAAAKTEASAATQQSPAAQAQTASLTSAHPAIADSPGNLSVPATSASAQRVAQSLTGRTSAHRTIATPGVL